MAAPKIISRQEWEQRAVELAEQRHLVGTPRYLGEGVVGQRLWRMPSRSDGSAHIVTVYPRTRHITCSCRAGTWDKACSHVGAVIKAEQMRQEAMSTPQNEPLRTFAHGGEW